MVIGLSAKRMLVVRRRPYRMGRRRWEMSVGVGVGARVCSDERVRFDRLVMVLMRVVALSACWNGWVDKRGLPVCRVGCDRRMKSK
jgi:hypothetical protein